MIWSLSFNYIRPAMLHACLSVIFHDKQIGKEFLLKVGNILLQDTMSHEDNKCSGRCKATVRRIVEQVRVETEQWSQMQEMLGQVRVEMEELQASRDFWEDRALNSDHQIQSLHSSVRFRTTNLSQFVLCLVSFSIPIFFMQKDLFFAYAVLLSNNVFHWEK